MSKTARRTKHRAAIAAVCAVLLAGVLLAAAINLAVVLSSKGRITARGAAGAFDADCVLVLGAGVRGERPTHMLADRLDEGIALYEAGAAPKLLMSGDHGRQGYDEVNVMKTFAVDAGVPSEDVFMDHAGFSTYESIYRAKEIFGAERVIIVTQRYHMYRALYIAERLGLDAVGVVSEPRQYAGQTMRDAREALARIKDFAMCVVKPLPTYMGEAIPVSGDGNVTNDRTV